VSKQAEIDYADKVEQGHLHDKPWRFAGTEAARLFRDWAEILEMIGDPADGNRRVLDAGAGPGWTSRFLARQGFDVVSTDLSPTMVRIAQERAAAEGLSLRSEVWDWDQDDRWSGEFDVVLVYDALHHTSDEDPALRSFYKALRPGGRLLVLEPTFLHYISPHARETTRTYGVTERGFFDWVLRRKLSRHGFTDVERYYVTPGPFRGAVGGFLKAAVSLVALTFAAWPKGKLCLVARKPRPAK
jgi:SAM-dependent methyltransferase